MVCASGIRSGVGALFLRNMATVTSTTTETEQNLEPGLKLDGSTPEAARQGISKGQDIAPETPQEASFGVQGFVRVQTAGVPTDMSEADLLAQIEAQQASQQTTQHQRHDHQNREAALQADLAMDAADDRIAIKSTNASVNREQGKDEFGNPIYDDPSLDVGAKVRVGGNDGNTKRRSDGTSADDQDVAYDQQLDPELNAQTGSLDATVGAQEKILTVSEQLDGAYSNPLADVDIAPEVRKVTNADDIQLIWLKLATRKWMLENVDERDVPMNSIVSFPRFTKAENDLIKETNLQEEVYH